MGILTVTPNPVNVNQTIQVKGTQFAGNKKTRVYLDNVLAPVGMIRTTSTGSFSVTLTVSATPKTQTIRVDQVLSGNSNNWVTVQSTTVVVQSGLSVPTVPLNFTAVPGDKIATLSWSAPASNGGSAITGYSVTGTPGPVTIVTANTSLVWTGLVNGTTYTFTIKAINAIGAGPISSPILVTPKATASVPSVPLNFVAVPGDTIATLSWSAPASNGGSAITAYYATGTPGPVTKTTTGTSIVWTGLVNGTTYSFIVWAVNAIGAGPTTSVVLVTPAAPPPPPTTDWEELFGGDLSQWNSVDHVWAADFETAASQAVISGGNLEIREAKVGSVYKSAMIRTNRTFDHGYFEAVMKWPQGTGFDAAFWLRNLDTVPSPRSEIDIIEAYPNTNVPPSYPGVNRYQATMHYVSGGTLLYHQITYDGGHDLTNTWHTVGCEWLPGSRMTFYFDGVAIGTFTSDVIAATPMNIVLSLGVGTWSAPIDGTTPTSATMYIDSVKWWDTKPVSTPPPTASVPSAPQNLSGTVGDTTVALSWSPPTSNGGATVTSYKLYRDNVLIAVVPTTNYTNTGLTNGVTYTYAVSAVNSVGESIKSASISRIPTASVPTQLPSGPVQFTANNQIIQNLIIDNAPGMAMTIAKQTGLGSSVYGKGFSGCTLRNVTLRGRDWGAMLIDMDNLTVDNVTVLDVNYNGIAIFGGVGGRITNCTVKRVGMLRDSSGFPSFGDPSNAYGMFFVASTSEHGISNGRNQTPDNWLIQDCLVEDSPLWMCYNAHEGTNLHFNRCTARRAPRAFFLAGPISAIIENCLAEQPVTKQGGSGDIESYLYSGWVSGSIINNRYGAGYPPPTKYGSSGPVTVTGNIPG